MGIDRFRWKDSSNVLIVVMKKMLILRTLCMMRALMKKKTAWDRILCTVLIRKNKKNYPIETGRVMREKYECGLIRNEHEFKEVLNNVLSGSERS